MVRQQWCAWLQRRARGTIGLLATLTPAPALAQTAPVSDPPSSQILPATTRTIIEDGRVVRDAVGNRMRVTDDDARRFGEATAGPGVWAQVSAARGTVDASGGAARFERDAQNLVIGADIGSADDEESIRAGVFGQFLRSTIGSATGRADIDRYGAGVYVGETRGPTSIRIGATFAKVDLSTSRSITGAPAANRASADASGTLLNVFGEVSYAIALGTRIAIEPYLASSFTRLTLDAFSESGPSALAVARQRFDFGTATVGLRAQTQFGGGSGLLRGLSLNGSVGARRALGGLQPRTLVGPVAAPTAIFGIGTTAIDRTTVIAEANSRYDLSSAVALSAGYLGEIGAKARDHAAKVSISFKF